MTATGGGSMRHARILITGASGFVGRRLRAEIDRRWAATVYHLADTPLDGDANGFQADIRDGEAVLAAVRACKPDVVIHLAAQASVAASHKQADATWNINFHGSESIARAISAAAPEAVLLFVSSTEVYGRSFNSGAVTEDTAPMPLSTYGQTKLAAEWMLADVLPPSAQLIIVRPSNHLGPGQDERFAVPSFAAQIAAIQKSADPPTIRVGDLDVLRDFSDVRDVVAGYCDLLEVRAQLPNRALFLLGAGRPVTLRSVLERLIQLSGVEVAVVVDPERVRPVEIRRAEIDVACLRAAIDWSPKFTLDVTLADVLRSAGAKVVGGG